MKYSSLIILLTICSLLWSQEDSPEPVYSNVLTEEHINIPGTKVFMIPGPGFQLAENITGIQKDGNTGIVIFDIDGGNYNSNTRNINRAAFESRGAKVKEYTKLIINGFPAKYIHFSANKEIATHQLIFGDSTFSAMLMATNEINDQQSEEAIKRSLFSVVYDKSFTFDPLEIARFSMDAGNSKFKFAGAAGNIYIYNENGVKDKFEKQERYIVVTTLPAGNLITAEVIAIRTLNELESKMNKFEVLTRNPTKINGYEAYEVTGSGEVNGKSKHFYQLVLVDQNKSVVFQGQSEKDYESDFVEFKKLAKTIKIK